jgi:hypothetical protein
MVYGLGCRVQGLEFRVAAVVAHLRVSALGDQVLSELKVSTRFRV